MSRAAILRPAILRAPVLRPAVMVGAALSAAVLLPSAARAQRQERLSADVSASVGFSNNPFATLGNDTGSALLSVDLAPRYQVLTERSTLTLSADANFQQYLRDYGRNESFSGGIDYQVRASERVTAHGRVDVASSVLGTFNSFLPTGTGIGPSGTGIGTGTGTGTTTGIGTGIGTGTGSGTGSGSGTGVVPVVPVANLTPITDIALFGLRNRRNLGRASGDVGIGVSARDTLTVSGYAEVTRYDGLDLGDYQAYSGSAGYSRRVSAQTSVGLRGSASRFDYRTGNADSQAYSAEATISARLNALLTVDGALGVTFVNSDAGRSTTSTSLSGSVNLCRRGQLSIMCAQAARQVSPTGLAGSQYVTSLGFNWSRQLSERDNLSLGGTYSKVGGNGMRLVTGVPGIVQLPLQSEFLGVVAGYDRRLGERLRLVASANYRQLLGGGGAGRPGDIGGQVGVAYRIGDTR